MDEIERIYNLLESFLGESKSGYEKGVYQYQFPCPRCVENYGEGEIHKYNLECNIQIMKFNCWKCCDSDMEMRGSLSKLIKMYGNYDILSEYKNLLKSIAENKLYNINTFDHVDVKTNDDEYLYLPSGFKPIERLKTCPIDVASYLIARGIDDFIIKKYKIGYIGGKKKHGIETYRVYIPSYDKKGTLNYWTGRDYLNRKNVVKYFNPKLERKDVIFNEKLVQWDADITLVEGPFDHIVVPNSIPLLGKVLDGGFRLFDEIYKNANAKINVWLDDDAYESKKKIYKELNHGRLYNKIRIINTSLAKDPSEIYQTYGYKGVINCLKSATRIKEEYL